MLKTLHEPQRSLPEAGQRAECGAPGDGGSRQLVPAGPRWLAQVLLGPALRVRNDPLLLMSESTKPSKGEALLQFAVSGHLFG